MNGSRRRSGGQSTVEFALVLPIVLLTILGILDLGRAVYAHVTLSYAVRDGCRRAIVASVTDTQIKQTVMESAVGLHLSEADITILGTRAPGTTVTVVAVHTYLPVTPIVSDIVGTSFQLSARSSMVVD